MNGGELEIIGGAGAGLGAGAGIGAGAGADFGVEELLPIDEPELDDDEDLPPPPEDPPPPLRLVKFACMDIANIRWMISCTLAKHT